MKSSGVLIHSVLAFTAILYAHCYDYILGAIYHYTFPVWIIAGTVTAYAALFLFIAFIVHHYFFPKMALLLLDFLNLQLCFYIALIALRRLQLIDEALPLFVKITLLIGSMGFAGVLVLQVRTEAKVKIRNAIIFSSLVFIFSPPLIVALAAKPTVFPIHAIQPQYPSKKNVAIVLLDELGYGAIAPIIDILARQQLIVAHRKVQPLGENTVNVIPSMLTGLDFSKALPCSSSAICSGENILDFSRMQSQEYKLNVVGFHHPYCKIRGLRYCYQTFSPSIENPIFWFGCAMSKVLLRIDLQFCLSRTLTTSQSSANRLDTVRAIDAAPFWQEGGVLYAHIMLPHPPSHREQRSLDEDYADNIRDATVLMSNMAKKLQQKFGDDFLLLITSDHPLRISMWCGMPRYKADQCAIRKEFVSEFVPIITASKTPSSAFGENNNNVFSIVERYRLEKNAH